MREVKKKKKKRLPKSSVLKKKNQPKIIHFGVGNFAFLQNQHGYISKNVC